MKVTAVKTHKVTKKDTDLFEIIDKYINNLEENSILVITSKIVSIAEGRIVEVDKTNKEKLVKQESQKYLDASENKYGFYLTITHNMLIPTAGIDESNGNGYYILWPENAQKTANNVRKYLKDKFKLKNIGILITDSKTTPLRWGTTGVGIAFSGFTALHDYMGTNDLFGRQIKVTQSSILDGLAAAAVLVMGEGDESTPLAVINELNNVEFGDKDPTDEELDHLKIDIDDDLYSPLLRNANWKKGDKA